MIARGSDEEPWAGPIRLALGAWSALGTVAAAGAMGLALLAMLGAALAAPDATDAVVDGPSGYAEGAAGSE